MAAGPVFTVLSNIPWGQVVDAAPKVAAGAGRLWEAAKNFRKPKPPSQQMPAATAANQPTDAAQTQARLTELEDTVQALREQMQTSAEVIKDLANQNALLVQRIELARQRSVRWAWAGSASLLMLALATVYLWSTR